MSRLFVKCPACGGDARRRCWCADGPHPGYCRLALTEADLAALVAERDRLRAVVGTLERRVAELLAREAELESLVGALGDRCSGLVELVSRKAMKVGDRHDPGDPWRDVGGEGGGA